MTTLLETALKKLASLPAEQQENIARLILKEIGEDLSPELIQDNGTDALPPSIGMGASGRSDLSTRCEELLWQEERF